MHIGGQPIHPTLIPFPIAFLTGAAGTDIAFVITSKDLWAQVSLWLIAAGFFTGLVAALAGLVDFVTIKRTRTHTAGWLHFLGNVAVLAVALVNWLLRIGDAGSFIGPWDLVLSVITAVLLGITGWTGGELTYRHQIGVTGH